MTTELLTEQRIVALLATCTDTPPVRLPPGWLAFARAIETEVRAQAGVSTPQVSRETSSVDKPFGMDREVQRRAANVRATLAALSWSEGTDKAPDPYRVCYGYKHTVADLRDHPALTGEWHGETLPDDMCRAAGFDPGCVSTAAGRYQIVKPTWLRVQHRLELPDFGPASQDAAAIELMREQGALGLAEAGQFIEAVRLCRRVWASLPGSGWNQPERKLETLVGVFQSFGGRLA